MRALTITVSLLALTACGDANLAGNDHAGGNGHAAGQHASGTANEAAAQNNPFAEGDQRMHARMMTANGSDVSETFIRKMIEHHRGALDMSRTVLEHGGTADVRQMAQATIASQGAEIEQLQQMLERRGLPRQPD